LGIAIRGQHATSIGCFVIPTFGRETHFSGAGGMERV
jgi:hypothetical protein